MPIRPRPRHLSRKGADFIAAFEGCVLHPYNDAAGHATIGIGHLIHTGRVTAADEAKYRGFTRAAALKLLQEDAEKCARAVVAIKPPITSQSRFDALVSLAFNLGTGILDPSHTIGAELRKPDRGTAADAFLLYDHAGAERLAGLTRRRKAERHLFLSGAYS